MLTLEWSGDPRLSEAGAAWVIALRDGHSIPYLLHTYHRPYTTRYVHTHTINMCTNNVMPYSIFTSSDGPLVLQAYTPLNKPWRLVGVADSKQLLVWKGNEDILPSVAVRLEGTLEHRWLESRTTCTVWH